MRERKWIGLFLVMFLLLGMISGCSPAEKGFMNILTEESSLKNYKISGSYELNILKLPDDMLDEDDTITEETLLKALNQSRVDYEGVVDNQQGTLKYDLTIVDKVKEQKLAAISIIYNDEVIYLKIDELLAYMKQFCKNGEKQSIDKTFAGIEYISIKNSDWMSAGSDTPDVFKGNLFENSAKQQQIYEKFINALMNDVYDKHESSFISKNTNNEFTFALRGDRLIETVKPTLIYSINNIDKLGSTLNGFVNGLSQDELNTIGLFIGSEKEAVLKGIAEMVLDVNQNREKYLTDMDKESAEAQEELSKVLGDSELIYTCQKIDPWTYNDTCKLRLHITDEETQDEMDATLHITQSIKAGSHAEITVPAGKVISFRELQKRMPASMTVWVDDQTYYLEQGMESSAGDINAMLIDNQIYLPMRMVVESMGDQVVWDETARQAYVERDGQRILLTGRILEGETYVAKKELEKLGYEISWEEYDRYVLIEKK